MMTLPRIAAALLLALACPAFAADFFVAPTGKDSNAGSLAAPFESIQKAQSAASPGDTVFLRGGTYKIRQNQIARQEGIYAYVFDMNKSGTKNAPINYFAFKDERPIFDFADVKPPRHRVIAFNITGSFLHFRAFDVTGVQVTLTNHTQSECFEVKGGDANIFENLAMHDGMGIGFYLLAGSNNLILNCDAYRNWDSISEEGRGGNTDGFGCHPRPGSVHNVFRGCRSWFNSDDGYDCINSAESVTFENCWAMYNGLSTEFKSLGDGNGFKAGGYGSTPVSRLPNPIPRHTVRFCLAVGNKNSGFYANHHISPDEFINNSAFNNGINFNMLMRGPDNATEIPGHGLVMHNNLGFKGHRDLANLDETHSDVSNNSFTLNIPVAATDFVSLDEKQLVASRQPNGDLPAVSFMHLTPKSPLAKAHLGAFEKATGDVSP